MSKESLLEQLQAIQKATHDLFMEICYVLKLDKLLFWLTNMLNKIGGKQ